MSDTPENSNAQTDPRPCQASKAGTAKKSRIIGSKAKAKHARYVSLLSQAEAGAKKQTVEMTRYLARPCPRCNGYGDVAIPKPRGDVPLRAVNGKCIKCNYRMAWIVVSGGRKDVNLRLCGMIETSGRRRGDIMEKDEQESFNQAGEPLFFECECDLVGNPKLKNDLKMARLKNRIAIITGAGQGIGRAIALGYAREGAKVVIADINEESARIVKNEIETSGGTALAIRTDVSIELSVRAMVDHSLRDFGRLDILVNNAGIFPTSSVEEMGEEEWDRVIGTNLVGVFLCTRAVVSNFIKQAAGRIISITSGRAFQGAKNAAHYAASGILCVKQVG